MKVSVCVLWCCALRALPLHNWPLVFDPVAGTLLMGLDGTKGEASPVLLQHLPLVVVGSVRLSETGGHRANEARGQFCVSLFVSCDSKKERLSGSWSYLGLLQVVADLLHERGIVSPLHRELSVLEVEAAAARLTLSVHSTICGAAVHNGDPSYIQQQQQQFQLILIDTSHLNQ